MNRLKNKIIYISLLGIIFTPIFGFLNIYNNKNIKNLTSFLNISNDIIIKVIFLHFLFVITCFIFTKFLFNFSPNNHNKKKEYYKVYDYLFIIFYLLIIYKILNILNIGFDNYIQSVRTFQINIGIVSYSLMIFSPLLIAYKLINNRKSVFLYIYVILLIIINLSTGYRLLVIWLILIIFFSMFYKNKIFNLKNIILGLIVIILLIAYQQYRVVLTDNIEFEYSIFDHLNRTYPFEIMYLYDRNYFNISYKIIFEILFNPFALIVENIFNLNRGDIYSDYYLNTINENLFREYLIWRGTPHHDVSGFSIGIVELSYIIYGYIGVVICSLIYGYCVFKGYKLINSDSINLKLFGSTLLSALILMSESPVEAFKIYIYAIIFLLLINLYQLIYQFLNEKSKSSYLNKFNR